MEKSIDVEQVLAGNQEQLSRVRIITSTLQL